MDEIELDNPIEFDPHEDISVAVSTYELLCEIDFALLPEIDKEKIYNTKMMCINIICMGISEIYHSNFYDVLDD